MTSLKYFGQLNILPHYLHFTQPISNIHAQNQSIIQPPHHMRDVICPLWADYGCHQWKLPPSLPSGNVTTHRRGSRRCPRWPRTRRPRRGATWGSSWRATWTRTSSSCTAGDARTPRCSPRGRQTRCPEIMSKCFMWLPFAFVYWVPCQTISFDLSFIQSIISLDIC